MSWLSENPWPLASTLGLLALGFLLALRVTQNAKYLIWAGIALGLALLVVVVEQLWVTDAERIEAVIYELGQAVRRSDADAALALLTADVTIEQPGTVLDNDSVKAVRRVFPKADPDMTNPARMVIRTILGNARFDFLTITRLRTRAGQYTRRGTAEFRVRTSGSLENAGVRFHFATNASGTDWSLGLRKEPDDQWRVERIAATRLPRRWRIPLGGGRGEIGE